MRGSRLYADWYEQVMMPPHNDFIICISASSHTPVSGTGKTTQGAGLAAALDRSEGGFDAEEQATLNAEKFANEVIPNAPDRGAVLIDETQGTPGEGSGINRMRAMSQSVMDAIGSILANRDKNLTIVIVVQRIGMLFSDLFPLIDCWLLIKKAPGQMGGPEAAHHKVFQEDYPDAGDGLKTPIVELVSWPAIEEDDPNYTILEEKKQAAKVKGGGESDDGAADEELTDAEQLRHARNARRTFGTAWRKLPEKVEEEWDVELSYSGEYFRQKLADELNAEDSGEEAAAAGD